MRYLTLPEALIIAEAVTGIDTMSLSKASQLELLDSALHAPQAGFGDQDHYPEFEKKAAVLVVRIARNHPLPDGNKRLAWMCLRMFCAINGYRFEVLPDQAVASLVAIAAGGWDEERAARWVSEHLVPE